MGFGSRRRRIQAVGTAVLAVILLVAAESVGMPAPTPARVTKNWAEPKLFEGECPVAIRFFASIRSNWGTVSYRWVRSDGVRGEPETIQFNSPDRDVEIEVAMEWSIGAAEASDAWAAVEIVSDMYNHPKPSLVGKATPKIVCTNASSEGTSACETDSENGPVTAQVRACREELLATRERALEQKVAALRSQLTPTEPCTDKPEMCEWQSRRLELFDRTQQAWQGYRDQSCEAAAWESHPGSFASIHGLECREEHTRARITEMEKTYSGEGD